MNVDVKVRLEAAPISPIEVRGGLGWIYLWNTYEYQILWRQKPRGMNRTKEEKLIRDRVSSGDLVSSI